MRIFILSWEYPPRIVGGISRHVEGIAENLSKLDNEVHVITLDFPEAPNFEKKEKLFIHRVKVEIPTQDFYKWVLLFNHFFEKRVGYIVHNFGKPDIVHVHDWLTTLAGIALKHLLRVPLVLTFHSTESKRALGIRTEESKMIHSIEWWGSFEATRVIVVSHHLKEEVIGLYNLPSDKVKVIYNGINLERFNFTIDKEGFRNFLGLSIKDKVILAVGRLSWHKGFDNLIRSLPMVLSRFPDVKLIIVGDGYMKKDLENLVYTLGLENKVKLLGFLKDEDLFKIYKISDLLVIPSNYEPFGIVALEGMAAGLPIIATSVDGLKEVINDVGLLVPSNHPSNLAQAIINVLSDESLFKELKKKSIERVKRFSWESLCRELLDVYKEAIRYARFE